MGGVQEKSEYAAPVDLQEPKPASRSKPRHRERRERASHPGKEIKFFLISCEIILFSFFVRYLYGAV